MASRSIRVICCGVVLTLASTLVDAGGWAVITVKDLPDHVVVGTPVTLTYAVRQHGRQLLSGLDGRLELRAGTRLIRADAIAAPEVGYYSATFTLPHSGDWTVDIHSGFSAGTTSSRRITIQAIGPTGQVPLVSETERGRRLFVGKGCVTCHVHRSVESGLVPVGPDLTARRYQTAYLQRFLAHPTQTETAKFGSEMPDLDLRESEIASLTAFLNDERAR